MRMLLVCVAGFFVWLVFAFFFFWFFLWVVFGYCFCVVLCVGFVVIRGCLRFGYAFVAVCFVGCVVFALFGSLWWACWWWLL